MKTRIIVACLCAASVASIFLSWAWVAGFNFDHRSDQVGMGYIMGLSSSIACGLIVYFSIEDNSK